MSNAFAQAVLEVLSYTRRAEASAGLVARLDKREWDAGLPWLDQSGLALYFWRRVQQWGVGDALPRALRARFEARCEENAIRTSAMVREWRELQQLFESSGVRCVVLKGLAKVPDYSPDPALRVQFDHDWLMERRSVDRVTDLLRAAGYKKKDMREEDRAVYGRSGGAPGDSWTPTDSYAARIPRPIEIHWDLWHAVHEGVDFDLPGDLIDRRVDRTWEGAKFSALRDEDALWFEAIHAFRHIIHNWCRVSVLYEIAHFLDRHSSDRSFWLRFCSRIEANLPLRRATGVVFTLAASVFGVSGAFEEVPLGFFAPTPALRLWVERYGKTSAIENFSRNKFSLFLLREFAGEGKRWRELRNARLFPLRTPRRGHKAAGDNYLGDTLARYEKGVRFLRRVGFHLRGALLYAMEFPLWRILVRREKRKPLTAAEASQAESRRTEFTAAGLGL